MFKEWTTELFPGIRKLAQELADEKLLRSANQRLTVPANKKLLVECEDEILSDIEKEVIRFSVEISEFLSILQTENPNLGKQLLTEIDRLEKTIDQKNRVTKNNELDFAAICRELSLELKTYLYEQGLHWFKTHQYDKSYHCFLLFDGLRGPKSTAMVDAGNFRASEATSP